MACCCLNILELCRVPICGTSKIVTGVNAPATGVYILTLDYLDVQIEISQAIAEGNPLSFPSTGLNEKYKYKGKITGPNGSPVSIVIGENTFDCITFQTGMTYPMNQVSCPAIDASEWELPDTQLGAEYYVELPLNGSGPYQADLISQPSWMIIEIVDDKIVLSGTVPTGEEHIDAVPVTIRASNCDRPLPDIGDPTFTQVINVTA